MNTTTSLPASRSRALHITLWVFQVLLATFFLMAGFNHGLNPIEEAAKSSPWITDVPVAVARFIGYTELLGGIGLILPAALRIKPWLTPLAALALAVIMLLAALFHISRGEEAVIGFNIIPMLLSAFVARGRWKRAPIAARV